MKHTLLISISLITSALVAQPTITSFVMPKVGDDVKSNSYDASLHSEGPAGANVTWDFSSITNNGSFTGKYEDPSTNPNSSNYPGTTILSTSGGSTTFLKASSTEWSITGIEIASGAKDNYSSDPREIMKFPITYQTVYNETFDGTQDLGVGGIIYDRGGTIKIEGDAYGTLIMPYGTIQNVLRVKISTTYGDELNGTKVADYLDVSYQWYNGANRNFLLSWGTFDWIIAGAPPTTYVGSYLDETLVGIQDNSFKPFSFNMAPNPAKNQFKIQFESESRENMIMELYDLSGRLVVEKKLNSSNGIVSEVVDVDHLEKGLYTVMLKYNAGVLTQKLIVQ